MPYVLHFAHGMKTERSVTYSTQRHISLIRFVICQQTISVTSGSTIAQGFSDISAKNYKMFTQEVFLKCKIHAFITFVTLITLATCYESTTLNVSEGEVAHLNFTYPCDSTRVTVQHSYRKPFYSSANPYTLSLPPNHMLKDMNDTIGNCWLYLTIDPVLKDNQGGYILTAYKNGQMLREDTRILLYVKYPPGKASCETSRQYADGEWVSLQCTAPVGTLAGQIVCYQHGMRLPSLTNPAQGHRTLTQTILARLADPVYCCSCSLEQTTDMCDCKDCKLDPIQNRAFTNITEPCPAASTTQHLMSSENTKEGSVDTCRDNSSLLTNLSIPTSVPKNSYLIPVYYVAIVILCVSFIILLVLYICKVRQATRLKEINNCKCDTSEHLKPLNREGQEQDQRVKHDGLVILFQHVV